ncbi:unnamed protein product, partial [Ranitomeya imitator]
YILHLAYGQLQEQAPTYIECKVTLIIYIDFFLVHCTFKTGYMSFNTLSYGQAEAEEIISRVTIPGEFLHTPSEEIRSRDLERELRRKTALELHYVKRIPRGPRVSLRPTLFQDKPDFCQKFESILNKCCMDIIILTIERPTRLLKNLDLNFRRENDPNSCMTLRTTTGNKFINGGTQITTRKEGATAVATLQQQRRGRSTKDRRGGAADNTVLESSRIRTRSQRDVELDLKSIQKGSIRIHRNVSVIEKDALRSLKENKRIVIKPAYKGGSIVVMDKSHYISIIQSQLNDRTTYQPIDRDPTFDVAREIRLIIKTYKEKGTIDAKLSEYLINTQPMTPVFYILHKVHKDLINPPGRPIVASTNSLLSPLAITLDRTLTPLLQNISSYLKDTSDFLSKLRVITPVVSGCTLVTLDVNSLYSCIDHQRGIEAVQWFLTEHTVFSPDQLQFCMDLLSFILHKNFFMFGDQYYIQRTGTAMGSNMAPPYANIFMAAFEETYVYTHPLFQTHSIYWKRYIDDVFMIWRGKEDLLLQFVSDMNTCVPNLSFSMQKSIIFIHFLDTLITLEADGNLDVDLYCKPTDKNSLLHYSSCHPRHVKQSLPISQFHRLSRIVSNEEKQAVRHQEMSVKFLQRGYPWRMLQKAKTNIRSNRENLGRQRIPFREVETEHLPQRLQEMTVGSRVTFLKMEGQQRWYALGVIQEGREQDEPFLLNEWGLGVSSKGGSRWVYHPREIRLSLRSPTPMQEQAMVQGTQVALALPEVG